MARILLVLALAGVLAEAATNLKDKYYCGFAGSEGLCKFCEGDCDTNADCETGYKCHQRLYGGPVPGCNDDGGHDPTDDYCVEDSCSNHECSTDWKKKAAPPAFDKDKDTTYGTDKNCCDKTCALHTCPAGYNAKASTTVGDTDAKCCEKTCTGEFPDGCKKKHPKWTDIAAKKSKAVPASENTDEKKKKFCCQETCANHNCPTGKVAIDEKKDSTFETGKEDDTCCRDKKDLWDVSGGDMGCSWGAKAGACKACEGDCDVDADCKGETGLKCFQRTWKQKVPGCNEGGDGDVATHDYCYKPTLRLYSDEQIAATAPASASALPYVGALAMVTLVAFVYIRTSRSHSARETELAEGNLLSVEQGVEDETLE